MWLVSLFFFFFFKKKRKSKLFIKNKQLCFSHTSMISLFFCVFTLNCLWLCLKACGTLFSRLERHRIKLGLKTRVLHHDALAKLNYTNTIQREILQFASGLVQHLEHKVDWVDNWRWNSNSVRSKKKKKKCFMIRMIKL